jgi:hypothetical protein
MANLTKVVLTLDDGTTQEFDAAVAAAVLAPTETVDVTPGESVEVVAEAAPADAPVA